MSDEQTLSNSEAASRLKVVCDEFERNWERGGRPRIEDFLDRIDPSQRPDLLRELILIECERRRRINETPRRDDYATRFPEFTFEMGKLFTEPDTQQIEQGLLFAVLAFEGELLDLAQLMAACRTWAADKTKPLADLLVERGWITPEDRQFVQKQVARKLAKHQNDPRVTLNSVTRGDVCDVLKELGDADINQSLSSWPSVEPMLVETMTEPVEIGQVKSRYSWVSEVGRGGLGKVWLARDNDLAREVALKEIKPGKSAASREAIRRLFKEAQITGQLQHPNIVPVYEMNRGDRPFYTMKLVKGETLSQAIKRHHKEFGVRGVPDDAFTPNHTLAPPAAWVQYDKSRIASQSINSSLSMQRLMSVFLNVCDALAYAHSRGIIHRDLKPQNIVLGDYGEAIVLDWGLARKLDQKETDAASVLFTEDAQTDATQAGSVLGSPPYMAPEQAAGQTELMDQRTDVYGLGAILFEILTDRAPHRKAESESIVAMLQRITARETPHVRELDPLLPEELDTICAKAMAKSRDERYPSAKELKSALLEFQVHKESIDLAASAAADLELARQTGQYDDYSRARFGFEEALRQWPNNTRAAHGIQETRLGYAESAFQRGDFDLALSLLEPSKLGIPDRTSDSQKLTADATTLLRRIQLAAADRAAQQHRVTRNRRIGIATTLVALAFSVFLIRIGFMTLSQIFDQGSDKGSIRADYQTHVSNGVRIWRDSDRLRNMNIERDARRALLLHRKTASSANDLRASIRSDLAIPVEVRSKAIEWAWNFPSTAWKQQNLLWDGAFDESGNDEFWMTTSYVGTRPTIQDRIKRSGTCAAQIRVTPSPQPEFYGDDVTFTQILLVQPQTQYLFSGWIKTEEIVIRQEGGSIGATLSIFGTYECSRSLTGTKDWTYMTLEFNSGDRTEVELGPRLGHYGSTCTGTAWFDDLCLIELTKPAVEK